MSSAGGPVSEANGGEAPANAAKPPTARASILDAGNGGGGMSRGLGAA